MKPSYLVEPDVYFWESTCSVPARELVTVSLVSADLDSLIPLLQPVEAQLRRGYEGPFRWFTQIDHLDLNSVQRKKVTSILNKPAYGFVPALVSERHGTLHGIFTVDLPLRTEQLSVLTDYRRNLLIWVRSQTYAPEPLVADMNTMVGGNTEKALIAFWRRRAKAVAGRCIECQDGYAVFQWIAESETADLIVGELSNMGATQEWSRDSIIMSD